MGIFSVNAYAFNNAGRVHVEIKNTTAKICHLRNYDSVSGALESPPPSVLLPNENKAFDTYQTKNGIYISFNFACGDSEMDLDNDTISFAIEQEYVKQENQKPAVLIQTSRGVWLTSSVTSSSIAKDTQSSATLTIKQLS